MINEIGTAGVFLAGAVVGALLMSLRRPAAAPPVPAAGYQPTAIHRPPPPAPQTHRWVCHNLLELHIAAATSALTRPMPSRGAADAALTTAQHFLNAARDELNAQRCQPSSPQRQQ